MLALKNKMVLTTPCHLFTLLRAHTWEAFSTFTRSFQPIKDNCEAAFWYDLLKTDLPKSVGMEPVCYEIIYKSSQNSVLLKMPTITLSIATATEVETRHFMSLWQILFDTVFAAKVALPNKSKVEKKKVVDWGIASPLHAHAAISVATSAIQS